LLAASQLARKERRTTFSFARASAASGRRAAVHRRGRRERHTVHLHGHSSRERHGDLSPTGAQIAFRTGVQSRTMTARSPMSDSSDDGDLAQIRRERELYRRLLDLGRQQSLDPFLEEALALVVEITGAQQGYLELREEDSDAAWTMDWCLSTDQLAEVRARISRGIVAEALATGTTIVKHAELLVERFEAL
jgi:hypothetical protein